MPVTAILSTTLPASLLGKSRHASFFSSHTTTAFALASSVTTVSALRGYPAAPYFGALGGALAATTSVLRIAADLHYASDVLVGALVGTGVGAGLPLLIHSRLGQGLTITTVSASPTQTQIQVSGIF
jgi:membrane-associated phospholipid phosphatase